MRKNLGIVLCVTALLSAMYALPIKADETYNDNQELTTDRTVASGETWTVTTEGHVYDAASGGSTKTTITNDGVIHNNGLAADKGFDINKFNNTGTVDSTGRFHIAEGGSNTGTISQSILDLTGGTFTNDGTITAETLKGSADITRSEGNSNSSLTLTDGSEYAGNIDQGSLTINSGGKLNIASDKTLSVDTLNNNGEITFNGNNTLKSNGNIGGTLGVKDGGSLKISQGTVVGDAIVKLGSGSTLDVCSISKVIINGNDTWADNAAISLKEQGTIDYYVTQNPNFKFTAESGKLNLKENSNLTLDGSNHTISDDVSLNIEKDATLTVNGGNLNLDRADSWKGAIDLENGSLTTNITSNGKLNATGGDLTIAGGSLTIGNGSSIAEAVNATINPNTRLNITTGGDVTFDDSDILKGLISLNGGSLKLDNNLEYTKLEANSGNLNITKISLNNGSYIKNDVKLDAKNGSIEVLKGELNVNNNDDIEGAKISTGAENSTFNYGSEKDQEFQLVANDGNVNILENSNLTLTSNSSVSGKFNLQKNAAITLKGANLTIGNTSSWDGAIKNDGGLININNFTNTSPTASFIQNSGSTDIINSNITINQNSAIKGGDIGIYDSTLNLVNATVTGGNVSIEGNSVLAVKKGTFSLDTLTANGNGALIDVLNGEIKTFSIGELNVATGNQTDFNIDIHARSNANTSNDQFQIGTLTGGGKLYVSDWSLGGDIFGWDAPIDRHIKLGHVFMDGNGEAIINDNISITEKTTFTPIGWYQLNENKEYNDIYDNNGTLIRRDLAGMNYTLDLVKYNPQVFRGQVATIAQWQNQLAIDDMLFTHSMVLPSFKDENGKMANNYAATNPLFAPYQYSIKDGGLWYKAYGTFEHLQMNQGLKVGNNSYGALIGADFGLKELKNGWKFMPTAYIGYNGAHQYGFGMGQYQNGGQVGFMGTFYKNNFILSSLVYGGVYDNQMDVAGHTENTFNYFAGTAAKVAYNWRFHRDWVLQPNLMAAYNYFGQQNWHSGYGQMGMMAGMLHGVNIAPGLNLIWEKETFSTYLTLQYMYNVNGASGGRAGNVGLPQVEMERGYIQYGIGFTKRFGDRFSGYLQAVLRNVGRTGVGFQAGLNIKLGK